MTILEDKVEEIIKNACADNGIGVAKLKEGGRGRRYTAARKSIAERLIANYGMTQKKIGELTGVSDQAISYLLRKNQASPSATPLQGGGKGKTTDAVDILHKRYIGDDAKRKASLKDERVKADPKPGKTVTIDFSGHAKILDQLEKYAKEEIRSVPDQILYFIQISLSWVESEAERLQE